MLPRKMDSGDLGIERGGSCRGACGDESLEQMGQSRGNQGGRGRGIRVVGGPGGREHETYYIPARYVHCPSPVDLPSNDRKAIVEEAPSVMTVEQQQAEQMKVYWKVSIGSRVSLASV